VTELFLPNFDTSIWPIALVVHNRMWP